MQDKEFQIIDLQKKMEGSQLQIKQQKAMYEAVRVEKNNYSKHLVQTQDEIKEAKRKLAISTQMVEHLKEQLNLADTQLEKGVDDIARVRIGSTKLKQVMGVVYICSQISCLVNRVLLLGMINSLIS